MDWRDIALHIIAAVAIVFILIFFGVNATFAAGLNAAFWLGREWLQKPDKWRVITSPQSLLEWLAPALAGVMVAAQRTMLGLGTVAV